MCGIAGYRSLTGQAPSNIPGILGAMSRLIAHRGPDGQGEWLDPDMRTGLAHRRLAIIDLSPAAAQPMAGPNQTTITYNGEI